MADEETSCEEVVVENKPIVTNKKCNKRKKECKQPKSGNKRNRKSEIVTELGMITRQYNDLSKHEKLKCIEYCIKNL